MIDDTVNNKNKTKSAMLLELESIKGLLREEDDIPILQEIIESTQPLQNTDSGAIESIATEDKIPTTLRAEQQDFFDALVTDSARQLLDTLADLEKATADVTTQKNANDAKTHYRAPVKATGENPFLPEHIRARLHGNNPPPLFEIEAAKKIANASKPTTLLGRTQTGSRFTSAPGSFTQQALIDDIMDNLLPEIEQQLRARLEKMSREMLENLLANKS